MSTIAPRNLLARSMSEDELDGRVWKMIRQLCLRRHHVRDSRATDRGFPDLVIAGIGGVLFRELKTEKEKPTPAQQAWLDILAASGADAACWRPSDLLSGRVARELTAISAIAPASRRTPAAAVPAAAGEGPAGAAVTSRDGEVPRAN